MRRLVPFFFLGICGCGDSEPPRPACDYPQYFKVPHVWLVLEVGGRPVILASGFLVGREEGVFLTARHFTDEFKNLFGEMKVFFNCRVYDADLMRLSPIEDAALIALRKPFDPKDFPEALPISQTGAQIGDTVYAVGFHPHPYFNDSLKYGIGRPVSFYRDYYRLTTFDSTKLRDIVFDSLSGTVIKLGSRALIHSENNPNLFAQIQDSVARYIDVRIVNHLDLPFGGLSGGALLSKDGKVLGIITAEELRLEYDPWGNLKLPQGTLKIYSIRTVREKLNITPISAVEDLLRGVLP